MTKQVTFSPSQSLIGCRVLNHHGKAVGWLKEVMLDANEGKIAYGVVSLKATLDLHNQLLAVPWSAFDVAQVSGETVVQLTEVEAAARKRGKDAPESGPMAFQSPWAKFSWLRHLYGRFRRYTLSF